MRYRVNLTDLEFGIIMSGRHEGGHFRLYTLGFEHVGRHVHLCVGHHVSNLVATLSTFMSATLPTSMSATVSATQVGRKLELQIMAVL